MVKLKTNAFALYGCLATTYYLELLDQDNSEETDMNLSSNCYPLSTSFLFCNLNVETNLVFVLLHLFG